MANEDTRALVGPSIIELYEKLSYEPVDGLVRCRADWIETALQAFSYAWMPPVTLFLSNRADESGRHLVEYQSGECPMRTDQILAARYWGIGVDLNGVDRSVGVANFILRGALYRLASDLWCLGRVCRAFVNGRFNPESVRRSCQGQGISFEHLIADVLNEEEVRATHAPLC